MSTFEGLLVKRTGNHEEIVYRIVNFLIILLLLNFHHLVYPPLAMTKLVNWDGKKKKLNLLDKSMRKQYSTLSEEWYMQNKLTKGIIIISWFF